MKAFPPCFAAGRGGLHGVFRGSGCNTIVYAAVYTGLAMCYHLRGSFGSPSPSEPEDPSILPSASRVDTGMTGACADGCCTPGALIGFGLDSASAIAGSRQTLLCSYLSAVLPAGLLRPSPSPLWR